MEVYIKSDILLFIALFRCHKNETQNEKIWNWKFFFLFYFFHFLAVFNVVYISWVHRTLLVWRKKREEKIKLRKQKIHSENFSFFFFKSLLVCCSGITLLNFLEVVFWHFSDSLNVMESSVCECYVLDADRKPIGKLSFVQGVKKKNVLLSASTLISCSLSIYPISISIL